VTLCPCDGDGMCIRRGNGTRCLSGNQGTCMRRYHQALIPLLRRVVRWPEGVTALGLTRPLTRFEETVKRRALSGAMDFPTRLFGEGIRMARRSARLRPRSKARSTSTVERRFYPSARKVPSRSRPQS
jgi:hypothetical protein